MSHTQAKKFLALINVIFAGLILVTYFTDLMLISIFSILVLFEFLFRMAGRKKAIQIAAVAGCLLTAGISLAGAFQWGHTPEHFVTVFWRMTSLTLLLAGGFIWIMKAAFSLLIQKRLAILLTVIAIYLFAQAMSDYLKSNAGQFFAQLIWPLFTLVLCVVLMKGPAAQQQSSLSGVNQS